MLMEDGHAASMKSSSRGLNRCLTGSNCLMDEIHMDIGRSWACFFTLRGQAHPMSSLNNGAMGNMLCVYASE